MLSTQLETFHLSVRSFIIDKLFHTHNILGHKREIAAVYLASIKRVHSFSALACIANGGTMAQTLPLAASWYLFVLASDIYDDIQDGDTHKYNMNTSDLLGFSLFLVALSYQVLCFLDLSPDVYREIEFKMRGAYLGAAHGQIIAYELENSSPQVCYERYFSRIVGTTAIPFAQFLSCGALIPANKNKEIEAALYEYGLAFGLCAQIKDDLDDLGQDIAQNNYTLPVLHGLSQNTHPLFQELSRLVATDKTETSILRIISILDEMGSLLKVKQLLEAYLGSIHQSVDSISSVISEEMVGLLLHQIK